MKTAITILAIISLTQTALIGYMADQHRRMFPVLADVVWKTNQQVNDLSMFVKIATEANTPGLTAQIHKVMENNRK